VRWLVLLLPLLASCAWQLKVTNECFATQVTWVDVRVGYKEVSCDGALVMEKEKASKEFLEALPEIAQAMVSAGLLACGDLSPALAKLISECPMPSAGPPDQ
jgi:hypothetical protein